MIAAQRGVDGGTDVVNLDSLPRPIREIEHGWIPLSDGTRLAYRCWLPKEVRMRTRFRRCSNTFRIANATEPRPATRRCTRTWPGTATRRFESICGGAGESDGLLLGEYLEQELADGVEVIAWLAAQPWCSGRVGMFGKSWGGVQLPAGRRSASTGAQGRHQRLLDR